MESSFRRLGVSCVVAVTGVVAVAAVTACVGNDPTPSGSPDGSSGGSSSGGTAISDSGVPVVSPDAAPSLGCPLGCLPPAPGGWKGPAAVYDGAAATKPKTCPTPYTVLEVDAHQKMQVAAADCSCGTPTFDGTQKCVSNVAWWTSPSCPNTDFAVSDSVTNPGSTCSLEHSGTGYMSVRVSAPVLTKGTCSFPAQTKNVPPPTFEKVDVACGLPQAASCESRADCVATPIPDQPFTRLCIFKDGDESCPSLDYTARFVANRKLDDDRACSACSGQVDATCGNQWGFTPASSCNASAPTTNVADGSCVATATGHVNGGAIKVTNLQCVATGGQLTGSATSSEPVTFCCNR